MPIDPTRAVGEVMRTTPGAAAVLWHRRMRCVGCPMARFCTLEEACRWHGTSLPAVLRDLEQAAGSE